MVQLIDKIREPPTPQTQIMTIVKGFLRATGESSLRFSLRATRKNFAQPFFEVVAALGNVQVLIP